MLKLKELGHRLMQSAVAKAAAAGGVFALAPSAHAAADITAITAAQTDILAYMAAMLALAIAVWGVRKIIRTFG